MSVTLIDQNNVDEYLHQISETKNDTSIEDDKRVNYERLLHYNKLNKSRKISRDYIEDGTKIEVLLNELEDTDWDIILEEIRNKEHLLRELKLRGFDDNNKPFEPGFIELAKIVGAHTTLIKLDLSTVHIPWDTKAAVLLKELKNNRSIKHIPLSSHRFDSSTAHTFAQTFMNNQNLLSLDISVCPNDHDFHYEAAELIDVESVAELARLLPTTALERLKINVIDNEGFKVLAQSLPKTLVLLDLTDNEIHGDSIPILCSYLKSNGSTLKELIFDDSLAEQYWQEQQSSSLSTIKILSNCSWQAKFLCAKEHVYVEPQYMSDNDWSELFIELTKDDTIDT